ncbi:MAG: lytic transglycosylase domain-containing protein [Pseudomonadota bacterium]
MNRRASLGWLLAALALLVPNAGIATPRDIDPALLNKLIERMAEPYEASDRFDAEVWLLVSDQRLRRFEKDAEIRLEILETVYREALHHGLSPDLVLAVIQVESAFNRFALSSVGAQGYMQIMPFWRLEIGRPQDNLINTQTNIRYGAAILAHYLEVAEGDLVDALGRYNGSRGRLKYPEKVLGAWRKRWRNSSFEEAPGLASSCARYPLRACAYR